MFSQIDVVNMARMRLGEAPITSLTENTEGASRILLTWAMTLDAELRAHVWKFATARTELAALVTAPAFGFDFQYPLPTDCVRILNVGDTYPGASIGDYIVGDDSLYKVEGQRILTDMGAPLKLVYTSRVTNTELWDASFPMVFAMRLAAILCGRTSDSDSMHESILKDYREALISAARANALESAPMTIPTSTWINARL